jgi:fructosamine-3-kinase
LNHGTIIKLFENAGLFQVKSILPLGGGEFNSLYSVDTADQSYVIKIAPIDGSCILTYETHMMEQEVYFYSLLRNQTSIRVPTIYYSDFSGKTIASGYFIMEKLAGAQADQAGLNSEEFAMIEAKTAEMVAQMHAIRGGKYGYAQNGMQNDWYHALHSMITNLIKDANRFQKSSRNGKTLLKYVILNKTILETVDCRMVNFDIWHPNILCSRDSGELKLAWIDLERCFWGDRIADFVSLDFLNMSLDKKTITLAAYNRVSDNPIAVSDSERIRFAIMLGYLGLIMEVEKYARYSIFHFGWWRNVAVCKLLYKNSFKMLRELTK